MKTALLHARRVATSLWGLVLLALALRLIVASLTTGADYDIASYHIQAQSVLAHQNVYSVTDRYPYPPVWVWLVALAQIAANATAIPFVWLVKLPAILGDCLIVVLLRHRRDVATALFYAANPVSILITAGHGQFDGLVMALVVAAWALWDAQRGAGLRWAALALGGAIALKGYPILLLPTLLIKAPANRQRLILTTLALTPLLVAILVYSAFFGLVTEMVTHVLGYEGPTWFGWSLYANNLLPVFWKPGAHALLSAFSLIARLILITLPVLLAWRRPGWSLERLWLVTLLGFYALAPALSAQYLLWALPLLALVDLKGGMRYTSLALTALILFYLAWHPGAVPWGPVIVQATPFYIWPFGHWAANLAWWLYCLWLLRAVFRQASRLPGETDKTIKAVKAAARDTNKSSGSSIPVLASRPETGETLVES